MKLIWSLMLGACVVAHAETEERVSKRFTVPSGGTLVIDVDFGGLDVSAGAGNELTVDVMRKISRGDKEDEETFLKERPITFSQDGNTLTVRSRPAKRTSNGWSWRGRQRTEAKYTITVPARFNADVKTSGGSIALSGLEGSTKAHTAGGSIKIAGIRGQVDAHTSGGSIKVNECTGPIAVKTSGGSIDIENAVGKVDAATSGGSVSAAFNAPINDEVRLKTSGGSVTLKVPEKSSFDLDASTSGGSVSSDLPVQTDGKPKRTALKGPVNGGGKPVLLHTSGGSVRVKKA
jgi:hypothetical protein